MDWNRRPIAVDGHTVMTFTLGSGPNTLLLVHGGPGCPSRYLRDSHAALALTEWRLVTWDQLGCGESDRPTDNSLWQLPRFVDEMEAVRKGLGLERFHVIGQSWGGVLGLEYLLHHPARVLSFTGADTAFDLPAMERGFELRKQALGPETCRMMALHEACGTTQHPEYQAAVSLLMYRHVCRLKTWPESLTWCLQNLGTDVFAAMFGPYFFQCTGNIRFHDRMNQLSSLTTPVLLVHGEHDYIAPELAVRARDALPHGELAFFPGCSHMPFFEEPDRYIAAVSSFLARQVTGP